MTQKAPHYIKRDGKWIDLNDNPDFERVSADKKFTASVEDMLRVCIDQYANSVFYESLNAQYQLRGSLSDKQLSYLEKGFGMVQKFDKKLQDKKGKHQWVTTLKRST